MGAELLLFFTRADLAEANEPVEETTDLASFLLNLELVPETSEEVLEETLPTEEKDLEVEVQFISERSGRRGARE